MTPHSSTTCKAKVEHLRKATGKPVMVGHGGYWTRLEFEKVPFFDIYDPETEPWYPAPLHTDLPPLVEGQPKVIWLRPQMYESVPYERWRYHVFVELMRGARGWQIAHGPGDASTFRGLHAELRHLQPAIYSTEKPPAVTIEPGIEAHDPPSRQQDGHHRRDDARHELRQLALVRRESRARAGRARPPTRTSSATSPTATTPPASRPRRASCRTASST